MSSQNVQNDLIHSPVRASVVFSSAICSLFRLTPGESVCRRIFRRSSDEDGGEIGTCRLVRVRRDCGGGDDVDVLCCDCGNGEVLALELVVMATEMVLIHSRGKRYTL